MHGYTPGSEIDSFPAVFEHIERHLGQVNAYWNQTPEGSKCPFQVVRCAGAVLDTTFFCTLGMASHPFRAEGSTTLRQELLIAVPGFFGTRNVPPLLQQLGLIALNRNRPFTRGEIMMGTLPVFSEWPFRGFYASHPFVIEDASFAECTREDGEQVGFVWLAPLYQTEIDFLRTNGPKRLETLFATRSIDLVDLNRAAAVD